MDELAITREPIRKHARFGNKCDAPSAPPSLPPPQSPSPGIGSLPVEIILEILSYLNNNDLRAVKCVSVFFMRIAGDPSLWRIYEVTREKQPTKKVLTELRRMPYLRKFSITMRPECDDILRQLSVTNRNLEELNVTNCTGKTSNLFLRSYNLLCILERCRNLHTIHIVGCRFRGLKFYRVLGAIGPRLRSACMAVTRLQFCAFIKHNQQIGESDREKICTMCMAVKKWAPFSYFVVTEEGRVCTALITYLDTDVVLINVDRSTSKLTIAEEPSS
ncbi:uncharacterized protein LOC117221296 [Megalopta genalis]|uniref:uncharacterized protein LOC117221296 n=1 Tax=Megalopta genalis TaxID=115081 RepID=UPI001442F328|nr:uncharacterized protein LOC117221296 [Megalopta genalis]